MTNGESKTGMGHTAAVSLAAVSMVVAIAAVGISVASDDDGVTTGAATTDGEVAAGFDPGEAQEPTIDEVSRHATDLPPSADYTRYENGEYSDFVERDGPITQASPPHSSVRCPGRCSAPRWATPWTSFSTTPKTARCRTTSTSTR